MIYAARFDTMNALLAYLTENCCRGNVDQCIPTPCKPAVPAATRRQERVP
jgi:hypothetical protein